jgi:RNA polymerase sigma-70 factor (ECF subfamily)
MLTAVRNRTTIDIFITSPVAETEESTPRRQDSLSKARALENQRIQSARAGNLSAFNELVLAHQDSLYWWILSLVEDHAIAEDITQVTFITAYEKLVTFRDGSFRSWLYKIARNLSIDELRRMKRRRTVRLDTTPDEEDDRDLYVTIPNHTLLPEEAVIQAEQAETVNRLLNALPKNYSQILRLVDMDGLDYQDVADLLHLPMGTVKSRLARARQKFRESILKNIHLLTI